jgi:hypothetical protein
MAFFAVLDDNLVVNVIEADTVEIAETVTKANCVEYTNENPAAIGWIYDGTTFTKPIIEADEQSSSEV